jgi:hypothetical protein
MNFFMGHGGKQCTMEESMQKEVGMERKEMERKETE